MKKFVWVPIVMIAAFSNPGFGKDWSSMSHGEQKDLVLYGIQNGVDIGGILQSGTRENSWRESKIKWIRGGEL